MAHAASGPAERRASRRILGNEVEGDGAVGAGSNADPHLAFAVCKSPGRRQEAASNLPAAVQNQAIATRQERRRMAAPARAKPPIIMPQVAGSGTAGADAIDRVTESILPLSRMPLSAM